MQRVIAEAIETPWKFQSPSYITHTRLEWGELVVTVMSSGDKKAATVRFAEIIGFRLLDEADLLEFWPICAADNGWLFRIDENGWLDLEASRPGFIRDRSQAFSEYFVASQNSCISVLASEIPTIEVFSI